MIALTFPGQGSQSIGMLAALGVECPEAVRTFEEASSALGYDLWDLCQHGPEDRLNATEYTQPAMLAAGVAVLRCWQANGGAAPALVAGHSLGEYSALVCAGSLTLADAARVVAARGRFMQQAVPAGQGGIAALLGVDDPRALELCAAASDDQHQVSAVNFNAPGQVVIAGHAQAVDRALAAARDAGARRAVRLPMSVPVHCELMRPAMELLRHELEDVEFRPPSIPVVHNADLESHHSPAAVVDALLAQMVAPVRWGATVERLRERGARVLLELGPGRVLTGLARRIDRALTALAVHDPDSLREALDTTGEQS